MSQPLGDAVLDLTADLGPLARKLAEARALTERSLDSMARSVDQYALRVTGMGQALDRTFLSPTARAFDRLALATTRFGATLRLLENTVHATGRSFADLGMAANVMSTDVGHALADVRRDAELTAAVIAATSDAERKAIDSVTAAYLLQSMAAKAAQRDRIGAARANAMRLLPTTSQGDQARMLGLPSARELAVVGAKGRSDPGGITNPIVVVIEASQFANLGSRAAAVAFSNMLPHVQNQIAQQIQTAVGPPQTITELAATVTLDNGQYAGLITAIVASHSDTSALTALLASRNQLPQLPQRTGTNTNWIPYGAAGRGGPIGQIPQSTSRDFIMSSGGGSGSHGPRPVLQPGGDPALMLEMAHIAGLLASAAQSHRDTVVMPASVASSRGFAALPAPGDTTSTRGEGFTVTPRSGRNAATANYQDWLRAAAAQKAAASAEQDAAHAQEAAAAAGGMGGGRGGRGGGWGPVPGPGDQSFGDGAGRRYDFYYHSDPKTGGGGAGGGSGVLSKLLWGGGGRVGIGRWGFGAGAGMGSIGSLAGFGPEHIVMTGLGIAGSAATGAAGAGLLGLGALGAAGVGTGSDALIGASTAADTKTLGTALTQLNTAVVQYGKNSKQAAAAQSNLNLQMKLLGDTVGVKAELQLAKNAQALDTLFDKQSGTQRVLAADIGEQALKAAGVYMPLVLQAAGRNLAIINKDIKPLFTWLEGPQGIGIFKNLENNFASNLPTAIHAFTQSIELVLRVTSLASNYTGGFVTMLDRLASKGNALSNSTLNTWIGKMIGDFRVWEMFVKALGVALADLFKNDAGTGKSIITTLTGMLDKLAQWEKSTRGSSQLHNIFEVHKQEVQELLQLLPLFTSGFGGFYLKVAPAFTKAATGMISAVIHLVDALSKLGPVVDNLLAIGLLAAKLKILGPALSAVGGALGLVTAKEKANTPIASADAAATGRLADAQVVDDLAARGASAGGPGVILPTGVRSVAGAAEGETATVAEEAGGTSVLAGLGASKFGFGSMGKSLATKIPLLSEESALAVAPVLSGLLAGGGGIFAGSMLQHLTHLRGGTAATLGGGAGGAGIGALIGSIVPGLGTAIGAALGGTLGSSLGPTIAHAIANVIGDNSHRPNYAQQQATATTRVTTGLQSPAAVRQQQAHLQQLALAYQNAQEDARQHAAPRTSNLTGFGAYQNRITTPTSAEAAAAKAAAYNYGKAAGQSVVTGLQAVKYPSTGMVSARFLQELKALPAAARPEAARTMLAFADQLRQSGQLPQHAVATIINLIEANFPSLAKSLGVSANDAANSVATAMKMTDALRNTRSVTSTLTTEFGNIFATGKLNSDNLLSHVSRDFLELKDNLGGMTKQGRQAAQQQMAQLRAVAIADATAMEQTVSLKMGMMSKNIASGSASAAASAESNFSAFSQSVATAMSDGTLATSKGVTLIAEALNSELKALGAKTIPLAILTALSPHQLISEATFLNKGQAGTVTQHGAHAVGGLVQIGARGEAGHDTVPLNVAGRQIVVGAGEQVAVFNRHQQPIVDRALAREGYDGLPGLFDSVQTPNYMAAGGMVKAPTVRGSGTVPTIVSSGLQKVTHAANALLGRMAPKLSGGVSSAGLSGSLIEIVHEIAKRMGWGAAQIQDWLNVISVESGGSMTATNRTSGAYGIAQMNTGTGVAAAKAKYYSYGGNPNTMVGQLVAMANYIKDTYTNPAGAWASEESRHSYARGGLLPFANGGLPYENKLQKRFAAATQIMQKLWGVAAPLYHQGADKMPHPTYTQGQDALFVGVDQTPGLTIGHRPVYFPNWFIDGQGSGKNFEPGVLQFASPLLETVIHEWVHEFQSRAKMQRNIENPLALINPVVSADGGAHEGGAQGFAKLFGPRVIKQALGMTDTAGPETPADMYYKPVQWVRQNLGNEWIENGQFGFGPMANYVLKGPAMHPESQGGGAMHPDSLAAQAFVKRNLHKHHRPAQKSKKTPRRKTSSGAVHFAGQGKSPILGAKGPLPFDPSDLGQIQGLLGLVFGLDGGNSVGGGPTLGVGDTEGSIGKLWDLINWNTNTYWPSALFPTPNFSSIASPGDFIISTDANGNAITPYISPNLTQAFGASGDPAGVVGQLTQAIGWQNEAVQQMYSTQGLLQRLPKIIGEAITKRVKAIKELRKRIEDNLKKIKALQEKIKKAKAKIKRLQKEKPPFPNLPEDKPPYYSPDNKKQAAANAAYEAKRKKELAPKIQANDTFNLQRDAELNHLNMEVRSWQQGLTPLEAENRILMGSTGANGAIGKGGELAAIGTQLGTSASSDPIAIATGSGASSSGLRSLLSTVTGWGNTLGGTGGDIATQNLTLQEWQQDLAALSPTAIQQTLTTAQAGAGGASGSSAVDQLLAQQNQLLSEQVAVSQAQYSVFAGLPPFGGSFAEGGVVPGPPGAARMIEAHGGETVTPAGGTGDVHVHIGAKNAGWLNDMIDVRIEKSGRRTTRGVVRRLPSGGGGKLARGQI